MRCGVFGKLPAKRDFIAMGAPRGFLDVWEPWLQGGLTDSRMRLGAGWRDAFLTAPIWRFWLGAELCGSTVAGAFMPSVDGVGRYFPLAVFAAAEGWDAIPPPELNPQEPWFERIEDLLLSSLEAGAEFGAFTTRLTELDGPATGIPQSAFEGLTQLSPTTFLVPAAPDILRGALTREAMHVHAYALQSVWWTHGGVDFAPAALVAKRMPDPFLFSGLLTGRFEQSHI